MLVTDFDNIALKKAFRPRGTTRAAVNAKQNGRIQVRRVRKVRTSGGNLVYAGYPYDPYA
jgi:hypothetical protein